ncbi:MAG: DUF748 domain-containing protein [Syntrophaceae bacterium]|nr:DUF748 domain-containing protein [Syntrophaceae bacterium]
MKKWFILIGVLFLLLIGGYFVLSFYAVKLIEPRLQKAMGPGLTLAEIRFNPTYLSATKIQYEDPESKQKFLEIDEVRVYPSLLSLLNKSLRVREITILHPSFSIDRSREGHYFGPWLTLKKEKEEGSVSEEVKKKESQGTPKEKEKKKEGPVLIQIDRVRIQRGAVDFKDRKAGEPPVPIQLRELDVEVENIHYPLTASPSPIELRGKVKGKNGDGKIDMKGWIDLKTMDLEANLKIRAIEVETFQPYYRNRVSAGIDSGTIDMQSQIVLKEKRIDAPGEMNLIDLRFKEGGGTVFWIPAESLSSLLKKKGNHVKVAFHIRGNLEDPQFNLQETFLTQIAFSLMEELGLPVKSIGEMIGGKGKGMEGWVEGFKSIEEMFKKKKEKKR